MASLSTLTLLLLISIGLSILNPTLALQPIPSPLSPPPPTTTTSPPPPTPLDVGLCTGRPGVPLATQDACCRVVSLAPVSQAAAALCIAFSVVGFNTTNEVFTLLNACGVTPPSGFTCEV